MKSRASAKIVLDTKHKEDVKKLLRIRITYNGQPRLYSIGDDTHRLTKEEFKRKRSKAALEAYDVAEKALSIAKDVISKLGEDFSFDSFRERYKRKLTGNNATTDSFVTLLTDYFEENKCKYKTKKSYETSVNWILRFKRNATLSSITNDFVEGLIAFMKEEHLKAQGKEMSENSIRMYIRQLRAVYYFAIKKGYTQKENPFAIKNLGSINRQKAALTEEELRMLINYTPRNKEEEMGKDFFFLTFYCSGANIGDILRFKNSNIENGEVTFIRKKTQKTNIEIKFKLTDKAKALFNKYGRISDTEPDSLILPYLANATSEVNIENRIRRVNRNINAGLKSISNALGLRKITTYTARHTFATILMINDKTAEQIQRFMGHSSSKTTETYLHDLSNSILYTVKDILSKYVY